jgi:hypothetical protein
MRKVRVKNPEKSRKPSGAQTSAPQSGRQKIQPQDKPGGPGDQLAHLAVDKSTLPASLKPSTGS